MKISRLILKYVRLLCPETVGHRAREGSQTPSRVSDQWPLLHFSTMPKADFVNTLKEE